MLKLSKHFLTLRFFFPWRIIALQCCGGLCHTLTWISHNCVCVCVCVCVYVCVLSLLSLRLPDIPPFSVITECQARLPVLYSSFPLAKGFKSRLELWKFSGEAIWRKSMCEMGGWGYWEATATGWWQTPKAKCGKTSGLGAGKAIKASCTADSHVGSGENLGRIPDSGLVTGGSIVKSRANTAQEWERSKTCGEQSG